VTNDVCSKKKREATATAAVIVPRPRGELLPDILLLKVSRCLSWEGIILFKRGLLLLLGG
jgi:hypothetical protein